MDQLAIPGTTPKKSKKRFFWFIILVAFLIGIILGGSAGPLYLKIGKRLSLWEEIPPRAGVDFNLFWGVWGSIQEKYVNRPVPKEQLFYGALEGMVASLGDPYSVFLNPEVAQKFKQELSGQFEGIGAEIGIKKERLTIIAPLSDTPADRAGLKPGDKVYAIDDLDTIGISLEEAVSLIRGEKGTKVVLTIMRKTWDKPKDIEIIRATIDIQTVKWEVLAPSKTEGENSNIGYIRVSHFDEKTENAFGAAVEELLRRNIQGIILDLRNNPGGYLDTAVNIAGFWIGNRVAVIEQFSEDKLREYRAHGRGQFGDMKTVVLVNQGSASGAEIIAGALQDWNKAVVMGEITFGKGSVQELETLKDDSALKLTVAYWLTPKKRFINEAGIVPDIEVELTEEDYDNDRDPQLNKALELLNR